MEEPPKKRPKVDPSGADGGQTSPAALGEAAADAGYYLKENDVGISEYISAHPGFFAIVKQRYSDFIVREISLEGKTVQLTTYDLPKANEIEAETASDLKQLISVDEYRSLQELVETGDKARQVEIEASSSKEERTLVHRAIRDQLPLLDSRTIETENGGNKRQVIRVFLKNKATRTRWPIRGHNFVKFVLYKENRDTMSAVQSLSNMLRVKLTSFQYAGTKDKRAITSQLVTVYRVLPESLLTTNGASTAVKVGNIEFCEKSLKLGDLKGNYFSIVLRNVDCETEAIGDAVASLGTNGFLNYFGMQRFGTSAIPTYSVGKALLHSEWREAIDLILQPRIGESDDMLAARKAYWESKDVRGAIALVPAKKSHSVEMQLLKGLSKYGPSNLLTAFSFLSRNQRLMYIHSYQSLVWNKMASCRVREFGLKPVVGDLVYKRQIGEKDIGDRSRTEVETKDVEYISEENVGSFSIRDVVLPLPGCSVMFPKNKIGEMYLELLAKDELSPEKMKHRVKDFYLHGDYRYLVVVPSDLQWEVLRYDDVTIPLTRSDLETMEGKAMPTSLPGGKLKALKLNFTLPPSAYATMALREVTRMDTSSHYQSQLNGQNLCKEEGDPSPTPNS